jgi:dUTP pyrophosphatase
MLTIKILNNGAPVPFYATNGAVGFDIACREYFTLHEGEKKLVPTGLFLAIPEGYEMQIRPRSGLALRHGVTVLNSPATIDTDYRGEIGVLLINHGNADIHFHAGDRIAQGVITPVTRATFEIVDTLEKTERGNGGFGSTGV